jgi:pimeloyl-ACP methyl ester carboxylesterase
MVKIALALAGIYLLVIISIALMQTRLLFPVRLAAGGDVQLPERAQALNFTTKDGIRLHGIYIPAGREKLSAAALILGFGGNAWNAETLAAFLSTHLPDRDVLAFHYRGYVPSEGSPSAEALMEDAIAVHDFAAKTIRARRVIAIGLSIGSGPAVQLARRRKLAGTVLVTPFDSLQALARDHYWWAPVALMLRHHMEIGKLTAEIDSPIAIIAAGKDRIVPPRRTEELRRKIRNRGLDRTIAEAGHNDIYNHPDFGPALREAVTLIESTASTVNGTAIP